jgi:uncharacterized protein (TIGR02996 family)
MSEAEAFERAILENPDDSTTYAAYADWLQEHDDPRGEFRQVQLALEDESRPAAERKKLQEREAELLKEHEREWLGELAPFLLDEIADEPSVKYRWRRGFLAELDPEYLTIGLAQTLATSPAARLLHELRIRNGEGYQSLIGAPCLESLRVFRTGTDEDEPPEDGWCDCHCGLPDLHDVIAGMARIEELHLLCYGYDLGALFAARNLTRLRVLRAYHIGGRARGGRRYEYPLDTLADNPAFANLTHLQFHPHWAEEGYDATSRSYLPLEQVRHLLRSPYLKSLTHLQLRLSDMGDEGVREIVASGILKRLKWLDLRHGAITDAGARLFAECPDTRKLERLDLSRNAVSAAGLNLLRKAKVNAVANRPLTQEELESREYLREGDFE